MTETDLVVKVVEAIANVDGVDQEELDPLYTYIDPGMLENLSGPEKGEWSFTFQYAAHQVTITQDEQIFVDGELYTSSKVTR
ncbi:HalOD1 output domain-containing protein [Natronococcus occultus]|uniref:Halobacterial output domain-containing protein n=1 Tax=Natronococcus occultus SP4 TaxID=694430 RepID=L0JYX0_9EURY|nr:HalOD1 output domain-containing protein [Natronococcus occultus]AGB38242.1 hypothetical protein Natoc_2468 [Natronococcus occultus SP4]